MSIGAHTSLKGALNAGRPVQMILTYNTERSGAGAWSNHQVLAYEYLTIMGHTRIKVYDPNIPSGDNVYIHVVTRPDGGLVMKEHKSADSSVSVHGYFVVSPTLRDPNQRK